MPSRSFAEAGLSAVRFGIAASVALLVASAVSANAAEKTLIDKGEVLVKENCSRCHASGKEGDSPHKEAPPFRTLSDRGPRRIACRRASSQGTPRYSMIASTSCGPNTKIGMSQSIQAQ